jgi:hypothetical protein
MVVEEVPLLVLKMDTILRIHLLVLVVLAVVVPVAQHQLDLRVLRVFNTLEEVVEEDTNQEAPQALLVVPVEMVSSLSDINQVN